MRMKNKNIHIALFMLLFLVQLNCKLSDKEPVKQFIKHPSKHEFNKIQDNNGSTIRTRFITPSGFDRTQEEPNSFQEHLRDLELKPSGSLVNYYNGRTKSNNEVYEAVVNLEIGNKDLHQCADAVMRLRAEYLWVQKMYDKIHFNFTNGQRVDYSMWMKGNRMNIDGNKTKWSLQSNPSNSYNDFWNYMELIFMYAGTASLERELKSVNIDEAQIGDVLIQGGHPGHAVIIVDRAINKSTGKAIYILAQSYMPAQDIQVLKNPSNKELSPWYTLENEQILTPEWTFNKTALNSTSDKSAMVPLVLILVCAETSPVNMVKFSSMTSVGQSCMMDSAGAIGISSIVFLKH